MKSRRGFLSSTSDFRFLSENTSVRGEHCGFCCGSSSFSVRVRVLREKTPTFRHRIFPELLVRDRQLFTTGNSANNNTRNERRRCVSTPNLVPSVFSSFSDDGTQQVIFGGRSPGRPNPPSTRWSGSQRARDYLEHLQ